MVTVLRSGRRCMGALVNHLIKILWSVTLNVVVRLLIVEREPIQYLI